MGPSFINRVFALNGFEQNILKRNQDISISNLHRVIISGGLCPWKHLFVPYLNPFSIKNLLQYAAHYPVIFPWPVPVSCLLPLKTKTQFLRRPFKFLVNGVLVLAGLHLEKPRVAEGRFCSGE